MTIKRDAIQVAEMQAVSLYDRFQADLRVKGFKAERAPEAPGGWLVTGVQPVSESTRRAILRLLGLVERFPEGLLVRGAPLEGKQMINLLDPKTGEAIWSGGVLTESSAPGLVVDNRVYVAQPDGLLAINLNTGAAGIIASFKLAGCEAPTMLERVDDGLLLGSEHNLMMLDTRGTERFHRPYRNPGCGSKTARDIAKAVLGVTQVALFVVDAFAASWNQSHGAEPSEIDLTLLDFSWLKELDQLLTAQRFEASLGLGEYAFMPDKDGNAYSIVKVRKSDGEEIGRLSLGKDSEDHLVDDISGTVFVRRNDREITAFRFPGQ
jgi:hypothetical protein